MASHGLRASQLWSIGLHLAYCVLILVHHWATDLPLYLGVLTGAGFLLLSWALSWVRTHVSDQARQMSVGVLAPMACLCWGAALSPFNLLTLLHDAELVGRLLALGLGPWALAWAIGGTEFRHWLGEIRLRLGICAALTCALFLVPHVFIVGMMVLIGIGLTGGWATYLAILTGVVLTRAAARFFAFLDDAAAAGGLNRARIMVLKGATVIVLLLLAFPPWRVEEQEYGGRSTLPGLPGVPPPFPRRIAPPSPTGYAEPQYGPPRTSYEPWYMCFYREHVQWVGPDLSGPPRLERAPANDEERIYARYVQPNRRLSLDTRRWLVAPGLAVCLAAILFVVLRGRKATTS